MGLRGFITKRIIYSFVLILLVISLNYLIFLLMPGDPTEFFIKPFRGQWSQDEREAEELRLKQLWGIGDPPLQQWLKYIKNLLTWQFGKSFTSRRPVAEAMAWRLPWTVLLMGGSSAIAIVIGVSLGALAAHKRGGKFDTSSVFISLVTYSLPTFWMGMLFLLVFYSILGWFPIAGAFPREWAVYPPNPLQVTTDASNPLGIIIQVNPADAMEFVGGYLRHMFLPMVTLVLFFYGGFLLLTRATMMEALTEDYIVTARAKGVKERDVVFRHALKNASLPLITAAAIQFGFMLSGAIITEAVFTWPGLGRWIFDAIGFKDYNVLQAIFYVIALCVIIANFLSDLLYAVVDPRIKYG